MPSQRVPQFHLGNFWLNLSEITVQNNSAEDLANLLITEENEYPALFYLCDGDRADTVYVALFQKLQGYGNYLNEAVLKKGKNNWNALHLFAQYRNETVVIALMEAISTETLDKALVETIDENNSNALYIAARRKSKNVIAHFIRLASPAALFTAAACKSKSSTLTDGHSALRMVLFFTGPELYKLLVKRIAGEIYSAVATAHQSPEKLIALGYFKELIKKYIFNLPKEEQLAAIDEAFRKGTPLHEFFKIPRGTNATSEEAGSFRELADQRRRLLGLSTDSEFWQSCQSFVSSLFPATKPQIIPDDDDIELDILPRLTT